MQIVDVIELPKVTTVQRDAIASPITGYTVWNLTNKRIESYNGTTWDSGSGISVTATTVTLAQLPPTDGHKVRVNASGKTYIFILGLTAATKPEYVADSGATGAWRTVTGADKYFSADGTFKDKNGITGDSSKVVGGDGSGGLVWVAKIVAPLLTITVGTASVLQNTANAVSSNGRLATFNLTSSQDLTLTFP